MSDPESVLQAKIFYYARERYYRSMKAAVNEALQKYSNDPLLKFLSAYCSILQGALSEGINELEFLKDKRDMNLCCYWGLMTAYKLCATFDKEAYSVLDAKLKEERKQAGDRALYHAGLFLFLIGKPERAREYIERAVKMNGNAKDALCLRGWVELQTATPGNADQIKRALEYFDKAMADGMRHADALLGKSACFSFLLNFPASSECVTQLIVAFPKFMPAMIEKMKIQLYMQDWDATAETALRCLADEPHCIEALKYNLLKLLAFHGSYPEAAEKIAEICDLVSVVEPNNGSLHAELAQLFSKLCGRDPEVLNQTSKLAEMAVKVAGNRPDSYAELGNQLMLKNRFKEAANCFDTAIKIDAQCADATIGLIHCQVLQGRFSEADHQLQFMKELQKDSLTANQLAQIYFLTAVLTRKKAGDVSASDFTAVDLLHKAAETQLKSVQEFPLGPSFFLALDPDFMIEIVKEYLQYAPSQPTQPGQPVNPVLKRCEEILRSIAKAAPGLLDASFLLAKVKFLLGDTAGAQATLQHCLDLNPSLTEAHILMSQILFERGSYQQAEEAMQQGLSFNFDIKENPSYQLLRSRLLRRRGQNEEALQQLQNVIKAKSFHTAGVNEKASVYLELVQTHLALGQQVEAARVVEEGQVALRGSPSALMRLQLADADLALARGDVETTLAKLRVIEPDSPLFVDSRQKLANIYLKFRRDQRLYISCYKEICDKQQNSINSLLMLGDAYMNILEAEKAIEVYETAAKKNPRDFELAQKIGQAHVKTHNYAKAVNYYEASLKSGGQRALYVDLLKLFIRLRHYEKAEKIIKQLLSQLKDTNGTDLQSITEELNFHWLYANVLLKTNRPDDAVNFLEKGKELQVRVLKRMQIEQPDSLPAQREQAVELCRTLADCYTARSDLDAAFKALKDALQMSEGEGKSMLAMARLCLLRQDLDRCQQLCSSLLKDEREVEEATLLMGEVLCQRDDDQGATELFQQFVRKNPTSFTALSRLIDLLRRAGRLSAVPAYFEMLDNGRPGSGVTSGLNSGANRLALEPGYLYCQGLYEWYSCNTTAALKLLNKARRDATWGLKASYLMVEISLNPDRTVLGSELFANVRNNSEDSHHSENDPESAESDQMALRTAEKLLEDVKPRLGDRRRDILRTWLLICRKSDSGLERAIQELLQIQTNHGKSVSTLYALSVAFSLQKGQQANSKKWLKELATLQWSFEDAEELERGWLLLADIYIASGNADTAKKLLEQCINHNKSCWRAYEYLGFLAEREKNYEEATTHFEQAWNFCNKNNPNIGFKYAFNCLRERRNVEAIETCLHILKNFPTYPRIRKEILEKARSSVRM